MCGIAGIFNLNKEPVSVESLQDMLALIQYRGPDESGIFIHNQLGIGNVRLSIIDLSTGQQPMRGSTEDWWIVYNGELFNYIELREELVKKGYKFRTNCDTEVVLKMYEEYGSDCLTYFNGQYAIAIWNQKKEELFLARDRMGIRPLFYGTFNNTFLFGSEIKTILSHPKATAELDFRSLKQVYTYWTTITPSTCFKNVYELPPGHYMKISATKQQIQRYWQLEFPDEFQYTQRNLKQATEAFSEVFEDAIKIRLRSDVPVAAYLSGGIDSSATTFYLKKLGADQLQTFSIGFADKEYDESKYQNEVADFLGTRHTSFMCTNHEIAENFPQVIWQTEYPLLRTAPVPMYLLSKHVREKNIKVVITGEGADEMLGGYNIFKEMAIRRFWSKEPDSMLRPLLLKKLYPYIPSLQNQNGKMLKFFFGYKLKETDSPFYSHLLRWNNTSKVNGLLSADIQNLIPKADPYSDLPGLLGEDFARLHPLSKAQYIESTIFMSGYLLSSQGDRMSMANSVEGRYPFLDYRVIELSGRMHPDIKLNGLNEKYILKKTMAGKIPQSVLNRSKQAYRAPISHSFLNDKKPDYLEGLFSNKSICESGIFDQTSVNSLLNKLKDAPKVSEIENMSLAAFISTQLLYQKFIVQKPKPTVKLTNCRIIKLNQNQ